MYEFVFDISILYEIKKKMDVKEWQVKEEEYLYYFLSDFEEQVLFFF